MPNPISNLERRILDYIVDYLRRNTYQPSIREIARRFGIKSTKTVSEYLQSLADKGWIERDPSRSRGVRVLGLAMNAGTVTVPHFDRLSSSAEPPVNALQLDRQLVGGSGSFVVALDNDEAAPDGLRTGDLLIVEPTPVDEMEAGDLVVLRTTRGAVVRPWENGIDKERSSISGRVLSVIRRVRAPEAAAADKT